MARTEIADSRDVRPRRPGSIHEHETLGVQTRTGRTGPLAKARRAFPILTPGGSDRCFWCHAFAAKGSVSDTLQPWPRQHAAPAEAACCRGCPSECAATETSTAKAWHAREE